MYLKTFYLTDALLLWLLSLFQITGSVIDCPKGCQCLPESYNNNNFDLELYCSSVNFAKKEIFLNATQLNFNNVPKENINCKDLSFNNLGTLKLLVLIWRNSRINNIDDCSFSQLGNLVYLDLSDNEITNLKNSLAPLSKLQLLNLTRNLLEPQNNIFSHLYNIQALYLSHNYLTNSHLRQVSHLNTLQILHFSYNFVKSIDTNIFSKLGELTELKIDHNQLTNIDENSFNSLMKLQYLDLSHNELSNINVRVLSNLYSLQHLDLSSNFIRDLPSNLFKNQRNLINLKLSNNPIYHLDNFLFANCSNLRTLIVENTNLNTLYSNSLFNLTSLTTLILRNNHHLSVIANKTFYVTPNLEHIDFSYCNISDMDTYLLSLTRLNILKVYGNPIICNPNSKWYDEWSYKNSKIKLEKECPENITQTNNYSEKKIIKMVFELGHSAMLNCDNDKDLPIVIWTTPSNSTMILRLKEEPMIRNRDRLHIMKNGTLFITRIYREDIGLYKCQFQNEINSMNSTTGIIVQLDPITFHRIKILSILAGIVSALSFLVITILVQTVRTILKRCGCTGLNNESPNRKQLFQIIESIEQYRTQQLEKLRENYTSQVHKIKDNCAQQVGWICDSYQGQVKNLKDFRDYGTSHLTSMKEQYHEQVKRVKEYSNGQLSWVRENYVFQRNRIRKFSSHQVLRFRESYKFQQQTLNKLLENLPNLYLENCRSGSCSKSESSDGNEDNKASSDVYCKTKVEEINPECQSVYYTPSELSESPNTPTNDKILNRSSLSSPTECSLAYDDKKKTEDIKSDKVKMNSDEIQPTSETFRFRTVSMPEIKKTLNCENIFLNISCETKL